MDFSAEHDPAPTDEIDDVCRLLEQAQHKSAVAGNTLLHLSVMLANMALEDLDPEFEREAALEIFGLIRRKTLRAAVPRTGPPVRYGTLKAAAF